MYRSEKITLVITMIASFLCCFIIADAQSSTEDKTTSEKPTAEKSTIESKDNSELDESKQGSEEETPNEESEKDSGNDREIDFFTGGANNLQSFNFMLKLPFEFKRIESSFSVKSFMTFKSDLSGDISLWDSLWKKYAEMETVSRAYALRLEGNGSPQIKNKLLRHLGGYIELESDYSIDTDPHVHYTLYGRWSPHTFIEIAAGGWGEARGLWGEKGIQETQEMQENEEDPDIENSGYGLRSHMDIEYETEKLRFSMMLECLPSLGFDELRVSASPEVEYRFKVDFFDAQFAFVLHIEIDYYSGDKQGLKIEPLTQLIRYRF